MSKNVSNWSEKCSYIALRLVDTLLQQRKAYCFKD